MGRSILGVLLVAGLCGNGCSGESGDASAPDSGFADAGFEDAEPTLDAAEPDATADAGRPDAEPDAGFDAGPLACPSGAGGECAIATDCSAALNPPSNCEACVPFHRSLCVEQRCVSPPQLGPDDIYNIGITVAPQVGTMESFATFTLSSRTAGGLVITCDDLYAGRIELSNACYNVLESRVFTLLQPGQTYAVSFASFASGERTLFVIYGFTDLGASGQHVGVSCTELDVGPPTGGGPFNFEGGDMLPP